MTSRPLSTTRAMLLVLLLAVGPLKAQALYHCEMMAAEMQEECCCDVVPEQVSVTAEENACAGGEANDTVPCCQQSATLEVDAETRNASPLLHPPDQSQSPDQPDLALLSDDWRVDALPALRGRTTGRMAAAVQPAGTRTWLITERLRL